MPSDHGNKITGQQHWLKSYSVKISVVVAIAVLWPLAFLVLSALGVGSYLDTKFADPINFRVRDFLGKSPTQDNRLKIFAIDDKAFALLGTPMPSLDLWVDVIDSIAEKKPRLIAIDAMFSARADELNPRVRKIISRIQADGTKVVTGSFSSPVELKFKNPLRRDRPQYSADQYLSWGGAESGSERFQSEHMPAWINREAWYVYGPSADLEGIFRDAGHFQLFEENKVDPFIWLGGKDVVPHLSMHVAQEIHFRDQKLIIDGHRVALDRHGSMPVNFIPRSKITVWSMAGLMEDARNGYSAENVSAGDVVVILPMYFTGNVDLRPSPYGWIPGGLYLAAMMNSVLTGDWLQPVLATEVLIVSLSVASAFAAYAFSASWFWVTWFGINSALFIAAQILFAYAGLIIPYALPAISGAIAGAHVFALKVRSYERKAMALRMALDGAVSPAQMENIVRRPDQVSLEPRERVVTLMFIDVVGFSLSSENMLPRMAFDNLKSILGQISEIIHSHGGVVDKTLGDGLLCYFGYRLDTDETDSDHPEQALRCAIKIQARILDESLKAIRAGAPIYPLRIGVNTASCYLGDLGSGQRIEFTVVGNGVNFAKRLESACDMFAVMIGATTYDLVKGLAADGAHKFSRKLIKIKHHDELIDAYEVHPLQDRRDECEVAMEAFRRGAMLQRLNERMPVNDPESIILETQFGPAEVMNFSGSGCSILMKSALATGSLIELAFDSQIPGLAEALSKAGMTKIDAEVRWSYQTPTGVAHGVMFQKLSASQQQEFIRLMTEYAFNSKSIGGGGDNDLEKIKAG